VSRKRHTATPINFRTIHEGGGVKILMTQKREEWDKGQQDRKNLKESPLKSALKKSFGGGGPKKKVQGWDSVRKKCPATPGWSYLTTDRRPKCRIRKNQREKSRYQKREKKRNSGALPMLQRIYFKCATSLSHLKGREREVIKTTGLGDLLHK